MKVKAYAFDTLSLLLGCALVALGLAVFTVPNNIAPGGLSGVATAVGHMSNWPVGILTLLLNIPLVVVALKKLGIKSMFKTLIGTVLLSILIDVFSMWLPGYTSNKLFAALMGGVVMGAGMAMLLTRGISTGGTDLLGLLLMEKRPPVTMGQLLMIIDTAAVLFAVIVFRDFEVALYSVFTIAVQSKTIDTIQQGLDHAKMIYIVTDKKDEIMKKLVGEMERGVTLLPAYGGFSGKEKAILMTVARRSEVSPTLLVVRSIDPRAFTILSDASAVYGEGFKD